MNGEKSLRASAYYKHQVTQAENAAAESVVISNSLVKRIHII